MALTTVPHLAQRLKKGYSYTSTSCLCLHGMLQGELYLYQKYTTVQLRMKTNQSNMHNTHLCHYYLLLSLTSNSAVLMQVLCYQLHVHTHARTCTHGTEICHCHMYLQHYKNMLFSTPKCF